jgi:hypothetical protein
MRVTCQAGVPPGGAAWTRAGSGLGGTFSGLAGSGGSAQESSQARPGDAGATAAGPAVTDAAGTLTSHARMPARTADGVDRIHDGLLCLLGIRPVNRGRFHHGPRREYAPHRTGHKTADKIAHKNPPGVAGDSGDGPGLRTVGCRI